MNFNSHIEVPNLTAAARIIEQKGAEQKGKKKKTMFNSIYQTQPVNELKRVFLGDHQS
jgi:hypothetical protein